MSEKRNTSLLFGGFRIMATENAGVLARV